MYNNFMSFSLKMSKKKRNINDETFKNDPIKDYIQPDQLKR